MNPNVKKIVKYCLLGTAAAYLIALILMKLKVFSKETPLFNWHRFPLNSYSEKCKEIKVLQSILDHYKLSYGSPIDGEWRITTDIGLSKLQYLEDPDTQNRPYYNYITHLVGKPGKFSKYNNHQIDTKKDYNAIVNWYKSNKNKQLVPSINSPVYSF